LCATCMAAYGFLIAERGAIPVIVPELFQCADHVGYETVAPITDAMVIPIVIDKEERIFRLAQDTMAHRERRHWRKIADLDRPKQFSGAAPISLGPRRPNAPKLVDQCVQVIGHFQNAPLTGITYFTHSRSSTFGTDVSLADRVTHLDNRISRLVWDRIVVHVPSAGHLGTLPRGRLSPVNPHPA
jgi:hypothetical protein